MSVASLLDNPAVISPDGRYRYYLSRNLGTYGYGRCCFIMLNPSTADASEDDPTIRRCRIYARDWGYGALSVVNLFAFRATDPDELPKVSDPVGGENDTWIDYVISRSDVVVAAWGTKGWLLGRDAEIIRRWGHKLHYLKKTQEGHPSHPLYLSKTLRPLSWR